MLGGGGWQKRWYCVWRIEEESDQVRPARPAFIARVPNCTESQTAPCPILRRVPILHRVPRGGCGSGVSRAGAEPGVCVWCAGVCVSQESSLHANWSVVHFVLAYHTSKSDVRPCPCPSPFSLVLLLHQALWRRVRDGMQAGRAAEGERDGDTAAGRQRGRDTETQRHRNTARERERERDKSLLQGGCDTSN
eukprot:3825668-Rhodomonas_salina.1